MIHKQEEEQKVRAGRRKRVHSGDIRRERALFPKSAWGRRRTLRARPTKSSIQVKNIKKIEPRGHDRDGSLKEKVGRDGNPGSHTGRNSHSSPTSQREKLNFLECGKGKAKAGDGRERQKQGIVSEGGTFNKNIWVKKWGQEGEMNCFSKCLVFVGNNRGARIGGRLRGGRRREKAGGEKGLLMGGAR